MRQECKSNYFHAGLGAIFISNDDSYSDEAPIVLFISFEITSLFIPISIWVFHNERENHY